MCSHDFFDTGYSLVCSLCGLERLTLSLDTFCTTSAPIQRSYDRLARFMNKVDKLLGVVYPREGDPVWAYLENRQLVGPDSVRAALRNSGLRDKHYDCVRVFCDAFTPFRVTAIDHHKTRLELERRFLHVHDKWTQREGFFSYDWLMRRFLEQMHSPLVAYLKPRTSVKRHRKYLKMLSHDRGCVLVTGLPSLSHDLRLVVKRGIGTNKVPVLPVCKGGHGPACVDNGGARVSRCGLDAGARMLREIHRQGMVATLHV